MNRKSVFMYVVRYLGFVLSFSMVLIGINALYTAFVFLGTASQPGAPLQEPPLEITEIPEYDYWVETFADRKNPIDRTVIYEIAPPDASVTLQLVLDAGEPLAQKLIQHPLEPPSEGFMQAAFGWVELERYNSSGIRWNGPYWSLDKKTGRLSLSFKSAFTIEADPSDFIFLKWIASHEISTPVNDEFQILFKDLDFRFSSLIPASIESGEAIFKSVGQPLETVSARVELPAQEEGQALTRQQFINNLGNIRPRYVWRLLFALVELIPLVVLALLVRWKSISDGERNKPLKQLTLWILGIHFLLYFLLMHIDVYRDYFIGPLLSAMSKNMGMYFSQDMHQSWEGSITHGYDLLFVSVVGVLVPLAFLRAVPEIMEDRQAGVWKASWKSIKITWKGVFFFILELIPLMGMGTALTCIWLYNQGEFGFPTCTFDVVRPDETQAQIFIAHWLACILPLWVPITLLLSAAILLVRWLISLMAISLWGRRPAAAVSWAATLVILAMTAYPALFLMRPEWQTKRPWGWLVLSIVLGTLLLYQFGMATLRQTRTLYEQRDKPHEDLLKRWGPWVLLLAFLFAFPSYYGDAAQRALSYQDDVARLVFALDNLFIYIWVGAILLYLYKDGNNLILRNDTLWIGALGAASVLFNVTNRWLYIPAAFLLGWLALSWLVSKPQWQKKKKLDSAFRKVNKLRGMMLENLGLLRTAERTYGSVQKKKRERIMSGDETFDAAAKSIQEHQTAINNLRKSQKITDVDEDFQQAPLAFGPYDTSWMNAAHGAKWSFLFAIPWLLIYFISFMQGSSFSRAYGLVFIVDSLSILSFWTAIGFFMGYFFPYLRGNNGLQKGLRLALALTLAPLPLHILHYQTFDDWLGFFFWAFQVFLVCMLLGLFAFDYTSVRNAGKNWETLFEIHGLISLGVWTSTVIVGLTTAISNWIVDPTKVEAILSSALQIILPIISQADKLGS